ncbi:MAG: hypothetical protein HJJLKODD_02341 [Phycisphaerae bacterium]|nr:hypothetical protein [Phycisphaerae bacterium]
MAKRVWIASWCLILLVGCDGLINTNNNSNEASIDNAPKDTESISLRQVKSEEDWQDFFVKQVESQRNRIEVEECTQVLAVDDRENAPEGNAEGGDGGIQPTPTDDADGLSGETGAPILADDGSTNGGQAPTEDSSVDFTGTNLQEIGVDEADVVKTDGEFIYLLVGSELRIVKAFPVEELAEVASVELRKASSWGTELYLNGNRLIAVSQIYRGYEWYGPWVSSDVAGNAAQPVENSADGVAVGTDPAVLQNALRAQAQNATGDDAGGSSGNSGSVVAPDVDSVEGNDQVSILPVDPAEDPFVYNDRAMVAVIDITDKANPVIESRWEFDGYYSSSRMVDGVLHLVLSQYPYIPFDLTLSNAAEISWERFIPQYEVTFFGENIRTGELVNFNNFYIPVNADGQDLYGGYSITTVVSLDTNSRQESFQSVGILADTGTIYASTQALYVTDPDYSYGCEYREMLNIHKFALSNAGTRYVASGTVAGRLLNQFSLSEYNDYLRVATTNGFPWAWDGSTSENMVFVLQQDGERLKVVGELDNIAPGEQIQSARFIRDRGFLVTFLQTDPLFTIDLSDPTAPQVAGELHVPGFSEYIHLLDENHLLTLGRAGTEEGRILGLQLSIFDITDFANPQLLTTEQIGTSWNTYSEAEYNHKAFTWYEAENLLAIPVFIGPDYGDGFIEEALDAAGVEIKQNADEEVFFGVQLYHITPETGIELLGQISTGPLNYGEYPAYYGATRALFIEQLLYAVTEIGVQAVSITDPSTILNSIEIEGSPNYYYVGDCVDGDGVCNVNCWPYEKQDCTNEQLCEVGVCCADDGWCDRDCPQAEECSDEELCWNFGRCCPDDGWCDGDCQATDVDCEEVVTAE